MKIVILLEVLKQPRKEYIPFLLQLFVSYAAGYGKIRNIIPEPTLQLRMCKGEKCEDHMPKGKP